MLIPPSVFKIAQCALPEANDRMPALCDVLFQRRPDGRCAAVACDGLIAVCATWSDDDIRDRWPESYHTKNIPGFRTLVSQATCLRFVNRLKFPGGPHLEHVLLTEGAYPGLQIFERVEFAVILPQSSATYPDVMGKLAPRKKGKLGMMNPYLLMRWAKVVCDVAGIRDQSSNFARINWGQKEGLHMSYHGQLIDVDATVCGTTT